MQSPKDTGKQEKGNPPAGKSKDTPAKEIGGRQGPDPTRYNDWEVNGRCVDF